MGVNIYIYIHINIYVYIHTCNFIFDTLMYTSTYIHVYTLSSNTNSITEQAELAAAAATAGEALLSAARRRLLYTYSSSRDQVSKRDVTAVSAVGAH